MTPARGLLRSAGRAPGGQQFTPRKTQIWCSDYRRCGRAWSSLIATIGSISARFSYRGALLTQGHMYVGGFMGYAPAIPPRPLDVRCFSPEIPPPPPPSPPPGWEYRLPVIGFGDPLIGFAIRKWCSKIWRVPPPSDWESWIRLCALPNGVTKPVSRRVFWP